MSTRTPEHVSSASQPDDDAVNRAKQEIQALVQEVVALSKSEIEETDFFAALLEKSISALAAIGGVVWTLEEGQPFKLQYQVNLQQTGLAASQAAQIQHGKLLASIAQRGEPLIIPPHSGAGEGPEDAGAANPTEYLLVVAPIKTDRGVDGLVEIFQRVGARPTTQRGYLRFLVQMCEIAGEYLKTRRLRHFVTKQSLWEQLESFTASVHTRLDSRQTAFTIANEGRRLIGCDRVTVVLRKGSSYVVEAISGQDTFDKRSNVVRMLRNLATVVVRSGEDLWYTGDSQNLAPQVEKAVNEYVDESHTKQIAVLPIREHDPHADDKTRDRKRENMLGAIIIEQLVDSRAPDGLMQRVDVVRRHSATALTNAQAHEGLFLLPLWRLIGQSRVLVTARNLPKTILASIAIVAAALAMWLFPWDFNVTADGKLQPEVRANVFAAADGRITDVYVTEGQAVKKGELLAKQRSSPLEDQRAQLEGEIATNEQDYRSKRAQEGSLDKARTPEADLLDIQSQIIQIQTRALTLQKQLQILDEQEARLKITSPIDGNVVTRKVQELLRNRPVGTGTKIMEIADMTQDWELELKVPEAKMGHIRAQLHELQAKDPKAQLEVTFILKTNVDVEDKLAGRVTYIAPSAEAEGEKGNLVPMTVAFDQTELAKLGPEGVATEQAIAALKEHLKVGADVRAKIRCGTKPIGYVWFHELWEFIQSRILFRM
ncbi:efflux RND transporter periplasmic adaptor subunit [Lacipirellula sp.]|uniref:efflux RND transporter periplasmic adaptor subunit n=1 Tax=Lacipirellula sp. TaxID=2691419 RepID=UPI003D0D5B10